MVHVVLAGGGTAGHTSPLIATAEQLRGLGVTSIRAIGTERGLETRVVPAAGIELSLVPPVPLPRRVGADLARVPGRLLGAIRAADAVLRETSADVVVGFGGYVSVPAYLAARRRGVPIIAHEGNALPGIANRLAAALTPHVFTTFPDTVLRSATLLGLPLRRAITDPDATTLRPRARERWRLHPDLPVVLVSGGSQGARSINRAVEAATPALLARGVQVVHVLGPKNLPADEEPVIDPTTGAVSRRLSYVDAMVEAYAAADVMVGRAGAGTVVETAVLGLPTIFVPLPVGNGEQARNARALVEAGGGLHLDDAACTPDRLLEMLTGPGGLAVDAERRAAMGAVARGSQPADAARRLAEVVVRVGEGR